MKFLNEKLLKNEKVKGQPQVVIKLHEEIRTLKSTLAKFVNGTENLDKLIRYSKCPSNRFANGYEGKIYVHDEDTVVCYFCGKLGHMMPKCMDRPRIGASNGFKANTKGPKKIWVPKKRIIPVADVFDSRKQTPIMYLQHMIGERYMFQCLTLYHGGTVTFKKNKKGRITRVGTHL